MTAFLCSLLPLINVHLFDDVGIGSRSCTLWSPFNRGQFPEGWAVMLEKVDDWFIHRVPFMCMIGPMLSILHLRAVLPLPRLNILR